MANAFSGIATSGDVVSLPQALLDVFSLDIQHTALGVMRYEEFGVMKTELNTQPGETVIFTFYNDLERGGKLVEDVGLETKSMSSFIKSITVDEFGNAVGLTEKLLQTTWQQLLTEAAVLLGRDYAVVRDLDIRDVLVAGGNSIFTTTGAVSIATQSPTDTMDIESIRDAVEALGNTNAPKFFNDFYSCFVHPHQASFLRRDPDWVTAHNEHQTRALFNGEIGRWEDVVFIQTTHQGNGAVGALEAGFETALNGTLLTGGDGYRATVVADQAYGIADALPVEMRHDGVKNFGRKHGVAWYAIWGVGRLEENNIQHIISG